MNSILYIEGERLTVVEDEDSEGWSKVVTLDGRRGQVPASYLQIDEEGRILPAISRQGTVSLTSFWRCCANVNFP